MFSLRGLDGLDQQSRGTAVSEGMEYNPQTLTTAEDKISLNNSEISENRDKQKLAIKTYSKKISNHGRKKT